MNRLILVAFVLSLLIASSAMAQREASFVQPGTGGGKNGDANEVISAAPRKLDLGETLVGITKRVQLYFTNNGTREATISDISISADSNVRTEITANDCVKIGKLKPSDQCSVGIEITPISGGGWSGEVTMVHDAPGRVSRAMLSGKTGGDVGNGQQPGLSLLGANKDQMIDFGEVTGGGPAVRSVLLANDSAQTLKIERLELVAAGRDLSILSQGGCAEGGEVAPGSSCPVTVVWQPNGAGEVSTDLIIHHTGPMGYALIPVRGKASGGGSGSSNNSSSHATGGVPSVSASDLGMDAQTAAAASLPIKPVKTKVASVSASSLYNGDGDLLLRGTSGTRAIMVAGDGNVIVAGEGESFTSNGDRLRVVNVEPDRVVLTGADGRTELRLQPPQSGGTGKRAKEEKAKGL